MQRIFLQQNFWNDFIIENKDIIHQLLNVLRYKIWQEIIFFNGKELIDYKYSIQEIWKKYIKLFFIEKIIKNEYYNKKVYLYQALPNKIDKIEDILDKATQIWVYKIIFFKSERSQKILINEHKIDRFKKIIIESVELSNRNILPKLEIIDKIDLSHISWEKIYFHTIECESILLKNLVFKDDIVNIFIWPEWGFSWNEEQNFNTNWFTKVYLWNNILRTQTAWIVASFYILNK